jgi:hypothetical protein
LTVRHADGVAAALRVGWIGWLVGGHGFGFAEGGWESVR